MGQIFLTVYDNKGRPVAAKTTGRCSRERCHQPEEWSAAYRASRL